MRVNTAMSKVQDMPPTQTKMREEQHNKIDGDLSLTWIIDKNKLGLSCAKLSLA